MLLGLQVSPFDRGRATRRLLSLAASLVLHGAGLYLLQTIPAPAPQAVTTQTYKVLHVRINRPEAKLVWYRSDNLPNVKPATQGDTIPITPESKLRFVTSGETPTQQVIRSETERPLAPLLPAPDVVAVANPIQAAAPAIPLPELSPPKAARVFKPLAMRAPERNTPAPLMVDSQDLPVVSADVPPATPDVVAIRVPKAQRKFVTPVHVARTTTLDQPTMPTTPDLPQSSKPVETAVLVILNTTPSLVAPPEVGGQRLGSLGTSARSTAAGPGLAGPNRAAVIASGMSVNGASKRSGRTPSQLPNTTEAEAPPPLPLSGAKRYGGTASVSLPFRPGARRLPFQVEARFSQKIVYATQTSPPPGYPNQEDWTIWFVEMDAPAARHTVMRPPVSRGHDNTAAVDAVLKRLFVSAEMGQDGRLRTITIDGEESPPPALVAVLEGWHFTPAVRDGSAVDVEIVIEIPAPGSVADKESVGI